MKKLKQFLKNIFFIFILASIIGVIAATNYFPGTWLSGWDNLHPEFNFLLNIKRSLFAVWQEYQGLGLLGGMGHAADLPRQIFLWIASFVLPDSFIRYFFHFLMLLIGPLGVYYLLKNIVFEKLSNSSTSEESRQLAGHHPRCLNGLLTSEVQTASSIGAIFYLFNLATLQMFYLPFEPYSIHYGFLPWLFWGYLNFLKDSNRKNLFFLLMINLLAVSQGYIITFFFVYMISLSLLSLYFLFKKQMWRKIIVPYILIFLVNAFWLLPNLYFVYKKVDVNVSAKLNQMSTEDNLLRNKKFGDLSDTMLLKGFWFDNVEMNKEGIMRYQMEDWRKYLDNSLIIAVGYSLFALVVIGVFYSIKNRKKEVLIFLPVLLFSFTILSNDTPFFSFVAFIFYKIPLFSQIFRFPFTKFSILTAFSFSIFFSYGCFTLINSEKNHYLRRIIFTVLISLPLIFLAPVFAGKLFYQKERAEIPKEYFQVFEFFKNQDKGRIANFPQYTSWGWSLYRWNYSGSGFLWYGIEQPILDRAFDVWSKEDENYYHEISYALYSRNQKLFEDILEKYQIRWLLVDANIISFASDKTLYLDHLEQLITTSDKFVLASQFGKIKIYKVNLETSPKDFVFLTKNLPVVGPGYKWGNYDKGYEEYGNYISDNRQQTTDNKESKTDGESLLFGGTGLFVESDIHEEDDDRQKTSYNDIANIDIEKKIFTHKFSDAVSNLIATSKKIIAKIKSYVNQNIDEKFQGMKLGDKIINPIYPADKLVNNPDRTRVPDLLKNSFIKPIYAKDNQSTINNQQLTIPDIYYPFRSLFTGRKQEELEFDVEDYSDYFSFKTKIPKELVGMKLVIPKIDEEEITEVDLNDLSKSTKKYPQIFIDGELVNYNPENKTVIPIVYIKKGDLEIRIPKINGYYSYNSQPTTHNQQPKNCDQFNQGIFTHERVRPLGTSRSDPDLLRLTSIGSSNCLDFELSHLEQRLGYLVTVENRNIDGKSLLFSVINKNSQRADLETYLPKRVRPLGTSRSDPDVVTSYFIVPPMEPYGLGYTLHFDNISIGRVKTMNDLGRISVNPIPYRFLTSLKIIKGDPLRTQGVPLQNLVYQVEHPNPSLYEIQFQFNKVTFEQFKNLTMVLSQSYDSGWNAYAYAINNQQLTIIDYLFPFLFGKELKDHVLVNNWENGWIIPSAINPSTSLRAGNQQLTIVIIYLPQYLEYIGFVLLGIGILIVIIYPKSNSQ